MYADGLGLDLGFGLGLYTNSISGHNNRHTWSTYPNNSLWVLISGHFSRTRPGRYQGRIQDIFKEGVVVGHERRSRQTDSFTYRGVATPRTHPQDPPLGIIQVIHSIYWLNFGFLFAKLTDVQFTLIGWILITIWGSRYNPLPPLDSTLTFQLQL
jgi:hypothetical protein